MSNKRLYGAIITGVACAICAYIAKTQTVPARLEKGQWYDYALNFFLRQVCGTVSKKIEHIDLKHTKLRMNRFGDLIADQNPVVIKEYSKGCGFFGSLISLYECNQHEVKLALGIGFCVTCLIAGIMAVNDDATEVLSTCLIDTPYSELVKITPVLAPMENDSALLG